MPEQRRSQTEEALVMGPDDIAVLARCSGLTPSEGRLTRLADEMNAALRAVAELDMGASSTVTGIAGPFDPAWPVSDEERRP